MKVPEDSNLMTIPDVVDKDKWKDGWNGLDKLTEAVFSG